MKINFIFRPYNIPPEDPVQCHFQNFRKITDALEVLLAQGLIGRNNIRNYVHACCGRPYDADVVDQKFAALVAAIHHPCTTLPSGLLSGKYAPSAREHFSAAVVDLLAQLYVACFPEKWCLSNKVLDRGKFMHFLGEQLEESRVVLSFRISSEYLSAIKFLTLYSNGNILLQLNDGRAEVTPMGRREKGMQMASYLERVLIAGNYETIDRAIFHAVKSGFDFSTQDPSGKTVFHVAAQRSLVPHNISCPDKGSSSIFPPLTLIFSLIERYGGDPKIDSLSRDGASALYYAIVDMSFYDARFLLSVNVSPGVYVGENYNPFSQLDVVLKKLMEIKAALVKMRNPLDYLLNYATPETFEVLGEDIQNMKSKVTEFERKICIVDKRIRDAEELSAQMKARLVGRFRSIGLPDTAPAHPLGGAAEFQMPS